MRHISQCLNSKLTQICMQAITLEEINELVLTYLPIELQSRCHVGSFRSGSLILVTPSAVWATELRYLAPELRDRLRKKLHHLISVQIKIQL